MRFVRSNAWDTRSIIKPAAISFCGMPMAVVSQCPIIAKSPKERCEL